MIDTELVKIKKENLMIGDYVAVVLYVDGKAVKTEFVEIKEGADIDAADDGLYSPIPLEKDMFVKNGWVCDDGYAHLKLDEHIRLEYYFHEHRLRRIFEGIDEWENRSRVRDVTDQCHCYYVNEMQHALKMCGVCDKTFKP